MRYITRSLPSKLSARKLFRGSNRINSGAAALISLASVLNLSSCFNMSKVVKSKRSVRDRKVAEHSLLILRILEFRVDMPLYSCYREKGLSYKVLPSDSSRYSECIRGS